MTETPDESVKVGCGREVERYWPDAISCGSVLCDGEIPLCGKCSADEIDRLRTRLEDYKRALQIEREHADGADARLAEVKTPDESARLRLRCVVASFPAHIDRHGIPWTRVRQDDVAVVLDELTSLRTRLAEVERELEEIREIAASVTEMGGCSDHSCLIAPPKLIGTNGGCRCGSKPLMFGRLAQLYRLVASTPPEPSL